MKTILVNPPSSSYRNPEEHLGLAYLQAYACSKDFDVDIVDAYLLKLTVDEVVQKVISNKQCMVVGISPFIDSLESALEISKKIKKEREDIFIVWGGHLATFSNDELLSNHNEIDVIVRGEGELTFADLLSHFKNGRSNSDLCRLKGISFTDLSGEIITTSPRDLISDLDILPFPSRDYAKEAFDQGSLVQISGSRGCYGNCSFCSINSLYKLSNGESWRGRSVKSIVDEIEILYHDYGFTHYKFVDDSFFGPGKNWQNKAFELEREIERRDLKIRFRISARANNVVKNVFQALKNSGLYSISVGIESGSQRALNTFKKGTTVELNKKAINVLKELEIITLMGFIGFDPYTQLSEVEENLQFLKEANFCLTDIISKPLFIHARDEITLRLLEEGRIKGRDFPNYKYEVEDEKARRVLNHLESWNSFNKNLFYKVSDFLTAPRVTSREEEIILLRLHGKMREIDLTVYEGIVDMIKNGKSDSEIRFHLKTMKENFIPTWHSLESEYESLIQNR